MATGIINTAVQDPVKPVALDPTLQQTDPATGAPSTNATAPTAAQPSVAGYNPTPVATPTAWNVTDDQTVAGQVNKLTAQNSPLMEIARTNAKQAANERGLVNSAMAVSAGEKAAYDSVLPIATQDAATYSKAAGYTVDQTNQKNLQDANLTNAAAQFNAKSLNDATLQQINNENQRLIQTNSTAASLMNQATGVLNNILMNDKMDANAKTEASRQIYENLKTQLGIISSTASLGLGSILGTTPTNGAGASGAGIDMLSNPYADQQASTAADTAARRTAELERLSQLESDPGYAAMMRDYQQRMAYAELWRNSG